MGNVENNSHDGLGKESVGGVFWMTGDFAYVRALPLRTFIIPTFNAGKLMYVATQVLSVCGTWKVVSQMVTSSNTLRYWLSLGATNTGEAKIKVNTVGDLSCVQINWPRKGCCLSSPALEFGKLGISPASDWFWQFWNWNEMKWTWWSVIHQIYEPHGVKDTNSCYDLF